MEPALALEAGEVEPAIVQPGQRADVAGETDVPGLALHDRDLGRERSREQGEEPGRVTKKWAGLARELFTTADTYVIALSDSAAGRRDVAQLLLAAGLAIDTVFKEKDD